MMIDDQRKKFSLFWKESEKALVIVLEKVFHSKWVITPQVSKEISVQTNWQAESFPKVVIRFRMVGETVRHHIFHIEPNTALYLFGAMIESEPDLELTDEHLEGLKEACNQIWGQLQPLLEDCAGLKLTELEVLKVDSSQDLTFQQKEGIIVRYQVVSEKGRKFSIYHYSWEEESAAAVGAGGSQEQAFAPQTVYPAEFQEISGSAPASREVRNIDMLMDVELDVYVELGRKTLMIRDILKLGKGSIIELEKMAGEPLGVFINGRKFAEGEVVVVDDQFGVRLTQLVNPKERIKSLG